MYTAPDVIKIVSRVDDSYSEYECEYMSDGESYWLFTGANCRQEYYETGTEISGSVASAGWWQCYIGPGPHA